MTQDQQQKSDIFLYTSNEQSEKELKKIWLTKASKTIKCQGLDFTKEMRNGCPENYRTLVKEIRPTLMERHPGLEFMD